MNCVEDALVKVLVPEKVLLSPSNVVEATTMLAVPLKETSLMVRAVWSAVAVLALPLIDPAMVLVNVCVPAHVLLVVVPKPRLIVLAVLMSGYVNASAACLLLKVVQSVDERYPAWLPFDWLIPTTPAL